MGDRNKLIEWQDKFHEHMAKEFTELERGTISINHKVTEGKAGDKKVLYAEDKLKAKSSFIQKWLGHSTFATTADTYSHLDFSSKQESAKAISAAFNKLDEPKIEEPVSEEPEGVMEEEQEQGMSMTMM